MVDTTLKNHLVSVFEDAYLSTLKNTYTGYATNTTLELITHLYYHYARISSTEMLDDDKNLRSSYNVGGALEGII